MDASLIGPSRAYVLDYYVDLGRGLPVDDDRCWMVLRCVSRKAYGCGAHGQEFLDGITLLLGRAYSDPTAAFFIHMNKQAHQSIQAELGAGDGPLVPFGFGGMYARGLVRMADEKGIVLTVTFSLGRDQAYYLIYNGESLSMVPHMPPYNAICDTLTPVLVPQKGNYGLVLLAKVLQYQTAMKHGRRVFDDSICLWSPDHAAEEKNLAPHVAPWEVLERRLPPEHSKKLDVFCPHVTFSCKGQAFWTDLSQGVLRSTGGRKRQADRSKRGIDLGFISLPSKCLVDIASGPGLLPIDMFRTIGLVRGSIKFVSIDHTGDAGDRMVAVWTLNLDGDMHRWTEDQVFSVRSIWEQKHFKEAGLPEMEPKCPVLMPNGDLCLLLPNKCKKMEDSNEDYICVLELPSKNILWSERLRRFHTSQPAIVRPNFFKGVEPLDPQKRFILSSCES